MKFLKLFSLCSKSATSSSASYKDIISSSSQNNEASKYYLKNSELTICLPIPKGECKLSMFPHSDVLETSYYQSATSHEQIHLSDVSLQSVSSISLSSLNIDLWYDNYKPRNMSKSEKNMHMNNSKQKDTEDFSFGSTVSSISNNTFDSSHLISHVEHRSDCQSCAANLYRDRYCPHIYQKTKFVFQNSNYNGDDPRVPILFVGPRIREQSPTQISHQASDNIERRRRIRRQNENFNIDNRLINHLENKNSSNNIDQAFDRMIAYVHNGASQPVNRSS